MKVLVTGLFTQAGLFTVRRFGELGYEVTAADNHKLAFGMYSKYVKKRILLPSLMKTPILYAQKVIEELEKEKYDFYFPSFEELYLMSNFREKILSLTNTIIPNYNDLMVLHDKAILKETVENAGAKYPETYMPEKIEDIDEIIKKIDYPVYIKMRQTRNSNGLRLVMEQKNIKEAFLDVVNRNNLKSGNLPIIQRRIKGPEIAISELVQDGEVIGETFHVGVRYHPRSGGTTTCRKTFYHDGCSKSAAEFLKNIKYTGWISIDYMVDEYSNENFIIDINPRPSVCINVGYYGGVDMIPEWIKIAKGEKAKKLPQIKTEVYSATYFADLMWYFLTYVTGPESWKDRKKLRKEWKKNRDQIFYDIKSKSDPKPSKILYKYLAKQAVKLIYTKTEAANMYLFYNIYHENQFNKDVLKPEYKPILEKLGYKR